MKTDEDTPENWMQLGNSQLVQLLRPLGFWLRDRGLARQVHRIWDTRATNGQYWEMHGWAVGPFVVPFHAPRRNSLEEMTTPQVLEMWDLATRILGYRAFE